MTVTRKRMRELTMKIVYEYEFYKGAELQEQVKLFLEQEEDLTDEDRQAILDRSLQIFPKIKDFDGEINENAKGWKTSRMSRVDLSIIRLALYEMEYDDEVPVKVAINEAVELAKEYGGDESPRFVNGILAKFVKEA